MSTDFNGKKFVLTQFASLVKYCLPFMRNVCERLHRLREMSPLSPGPLFLPVFHCHIYGPSYCEKGLFLPDLSKLYAFLSETILILVIVYFYSLSHVLKLYWPLSYDSQECNQNKYIFVSPWFARLLTIEKKDNPKK